MPIEVELPDGNIAEFPDGTPPAEIERVLQAQFGSPQQAREPSRIGGLVNAQRQMTGALVEPVLSMATGAAATPIAGLAGIGSGLITALQNLGLPESEQRSAADAAVRAIERVRGGLTYEPRTAGGDIASQVVGAPSAPIAAAQEVASQKAGDIGYDVSGPVGGAIGSIVPAVAEIAAGGIAGRMGRGSGATLETPPPGLDKPIVRGSPEFNSQIAREIKERNLATEAEKSGAEPPANLSPATDETFARYSVDDKGRVISDDAASRAIDEGATPGMIASIKEASKKDRFRMLQMLSSMRKGLENAKYSVRNRPADVAGQTLLERINLVKQQNKIAGSKLDSEARKLQGQQVDFNKPFQGFYKALENIDVTFDADGAPVFKGSQIEGVAGAENAVKRMVARMESKSNPDAYDLHKLKRYIDEQVSYGKAGEGLTGRTEGILKGFRSDIDDLLDTNFKDYDKVNTQYSDTIAAIDAFQDSAGSKVDLFGPNADKALGTVTRRLMGNTQSRANMFTAIDELEKVARKYGGKIEDDLEVQARFADELDAIFGPVGRTSLQGQMSQPIERLARELKGDKSLRERAVEGVTEAIKGKPSPLKDEAFKALEEILKRDLQ